MPAKPLLIFEPFPSTDLHDLVENHVVTVATAITGALEYQPVGYFLRQDRGEWVGGCIGYVWGNYLHVQWLWVAEIWRGQGQGARLLDAAEAMAQDHGAASATLETLNPAAKSFYLSRGYEIFATLDNYAGNYGKYFLRKTLKGNVPRR